MSKPRLIAFYLPQFYPTPENDEWWGKGFTEWTNVARAKPLFHGHNQPRIPADLGFYDLRVPETRERQAEMAREAGIEGFMYWHYWFGNGKRLLDRVFREVVEWGKPDFPFALCWANHSWYAKTWDPTKPDKLLIEQTYPGEEDYIAHFNEMLPAFKDPRYIKVNGRLLFGIFDPMAIPDPKLFMDTWNRLAKENGLEGFHFLGHGGKRTTKYSEVMGLGYDSTSYDALTKALHEDVPIYRKLLRVAVHRPAFLKYKKYVDSFLESYKVEANVYPMLIPRYDHSPRSTYKGQILTHDDPKEWKRLCMETFRKTAQRDHEENIVYLMAWNEWGEGNYLEPDITSGDGHLKALREAYDEFDQ